MDSKSTLYLTVFDGSYVLEFWTKAICRIIVSNGLCGVDLTNGFVKEGSVVLRSDREIQGVHCFNREIQGSVVLRFDHGIEATDL